MARKKASTTKKPARGAKKATKKRARKKASSKKPLPMVQQGVETPDEVQAQVWVLREEGMSLRAIARELGMNVATVQRILHRDPARLRTLVRAQSEERARQWEQLENRSLKTVNQLAKAVHDALFDEKGERRKERLKPSEREFLDVSRPWAGILRLAADSSAKAQERLGTTTADASSSPGVQGGIGGDMPDDMTPEQMAQTAIDLDMVDKLNPELRKVAERLLEEQRGGEA